MRRIAIYARQSLDVREGIDRQLTRCRSLAEARGWEVVAEYEDNDVSASKGRGDGTAWARLLADIEAGRVDTVIAVDLDRLLRQVRDLVTLTDLGASVVTVDGEIDLSTADGEFRATMLAGIARFEARRKAERQRRANEARVAKGRPVPGRRRFGYESDGVTPRESEAVRVRWMFEQIHRGASLRSLTQRLIADGVDPSPGREWSNRRVRDILTNPVYGGMVRHRGQVLPGAAITPLVPAELAAEVRAILADPSRKTTPGNRVKHLASGIARCGVCGSTLYFMRDYRCRKDTHHPSIVKHRLDPAIRQAVVEVVTEGRLPDGAPETDPTVNVRLAELRERRVRAQEVALLPGADLGHLRRVLAELEAEEQALVAKVSVQAARASRQWFWQQVVLKLYQAGDSADPHAAISDAWDGLDLDEQRAFLRSHMTITVHPGRSDDRVVIERVA